MVPWLVPRSLLFEILFHPFLVLKSTAKCFQNGSELRRTVDPKRRRRKSKSLSSSLLVWAVWKQQPHRILPNVSCTGPCGMSLSAHACPWSRSTRGRSFPSEPPLARHLPTAGSQHQRFDCMPAGRAAVRSNHRSIPRRSQLLMKNR